MSETTNIEWETSTGNPWIGCTKVSPGCKNCYAAELDENRFSKTMGGGTTAKPISHWGKGAPRVRTKGFWKYALKWNREAGKTGCGDCDPCIGGRPDQCAVGAMERPRIFPSLCDWLDEEVPIEWLADFLKLVHDTPNLDWLLLTKRPESFKGRLNAVLDAPAKGIWSVGRQTAEFLCDWLEEKPPANVWIGVSVEDQKRADERIPLLLQIPAKVRFLSVEPLLEPVDLRYAAFTGAESFSTMGRIDWVIIGGESGKDRRDCGVEAICDVARQCVAAGVPVFTKQDCAFKPGQKGRTPDDIWALKQFPRLPFD